MPEFINLTGKKINKWTVIERGPNSRTGGNARWWCECACGRRRLVQSDTLRNNKSRSCMNCRRRSAHGDIMGEYWSSLKHHAKARNVPITLTIQDFWELFLDQDKRCALTGLELCFAPSTKQKSEQTASLDRIDSDKGYIPGNVQWVHKDINRMKSTLLQERFLELCNLVSNYARH